MTINIGICKICHKKFWRNGLDKDNMLHHINLEHLNEKIKWREMYDIANKKGMELLDYEKSLWEIKHNAKEERDSQ